MSKETIRAATFKDLIAKKLEREEAKNKTHEIEIPGTGLSLIIKKPDEDFLLNILDEIDEVNATSSTAEAYKKLIYHSCQIFQDQEFQKELDVVDPYDTVSAVLNINERLYLGQKIMEISGIAELEANIKN